MSKRYEKMSKEEIVEFIGECQDRACGACPAAEVDAFGPNCIKGYLTAEVSPKKRWQTIQSDEDVKRIHREFKDYCNTHECFDCKYDESDVFKSCFVKFLIDEIEVPE